MILQIIKYRARFNRAMRNLHYAKSPYSTDSEKQMYAQSVGRILSEIGLIYEVSKSS